MFRSNDTVMLFVVYAVALLLPSVANATNKWWKIAPSTCAISTDNFSSIDNGDIDASISTTSLPGNQYGSLFCPVMLPDGVTINKLRIRTFQSGGLPVSTSMFVSLVKRSWTGTQTGVSECLMDDAGDTYADNTTAVSHVVNNEVYEYYLWIYAVEYTGHTSQPEVSMIEVRYDE